MNSLDLLLIGTIFGIVLHDLYLLFTCKIVGQLNIDISDETKDIYTFEVNVPLDRLTKYKMIRVKIKDSSD